MNTVRQIFRYYVVMSNLIGVKEKKRGKAERKEEAEGEIKRFYFRFNSTRLLAYLY